MTFLGNSSMPNYVKLVAVAMLAVTYLAALTVGTADYIGGHPIPSEVALIIGTGLGVAMNILGVHTGAQLTEGSAVTLTGASNASTPTP